MTGCRICITSQIISIITRQSPFYVQSFSVINVQSLQFVCEACSSISAWCYLVLQLSCGNWAFSKIVRSCKRCDEKLPWFTVELNLYSVPNRNIMVTCKDIEIKNYNYNFLDCDWLKNSYFSLIHLPSCYRTNHIQSCSFARARLLFLFLAPN